MTLRRISFGASTVALDAHGARANAVADFLFGHLPDGGGVPQITLCLEADDGGLSLRAEGEVGYRAASEAAMAEYVLGRVCFHLADRSHNGLLLHAAALRRNGRGLIVPGSSGAGKSTLTAWLSERGFSYLTDELVYVPDGALSFSALGRPLNLKPSAHGDLPVLFADSHDILAGDSAALIAPSRLGLPADLEPTPLCAFLFVRFDVGATFEWTRLSAAQAGLALMQCLVNARNLSEHGFREASRLCRLTPAYRLVYKDFAELERRLPELSAVLD